ncbi:MAG TPA: N-acetylmuramoyl-L-alanine amidase [Symbiobacteriaceae bacterium]|nr:N-acetylmuramoyl-L-alanine amidase [Symbiobacteriaceae bacterium]
MWQRRWLCLLLPLLLCFAIGLAPEEGRPAWNEQLTCPANHPIVIDPGHGGGDGGTAHGGAIEKDIVLDIGLRLRDELQKQQIPVVMTRTKDVGFGPVRSDLAYRAFVANKCAASLFLSLHINANGKSDQRGFTVYYGAGRLSRDAAVLYDRAMRDAGLHWRREPPHQNKTFVVIYSTASPAVLLELGFLTNPGDRGNLQWAPYRERIAHVLADATAKIYRGWIE